MDGYRCSTWLCARIRKILGVNAVERREVAVHVDQEYRDIDKLTPLASILLQDGFDIRENTMYLSFKVKCFEVAVVVQLQAGHHAVMHITSCNTRADAT